METLYINIKEALPERGINIEYVEEDGSTGTAYLCKRCGACWRDIITGSGMCIIPVKWRYLE